MRPLALTIRAFGPYATEQALDFADLGGRTLFLIHGPTGAGKTSILDAMCFALYGSASGEERGARDLRCGHADPGIETEVIFDFAVGDAAYRILRGPGGERPKKRGTGTVTTPPHATLWRRGAGRDGGDGHVLASAPNKVTDAVREILGFESRQFRQVVLLPQGQFGRLLLADSKDREKILETLFRTEIYRRIEEALKEGAKKLEGEAREIRSHEDEVLAQAGAAGPDDIAAARDAALALKSAAAAALESAREAARSAREALDRAKETAGRIRERDEAARALAALEAGVAACEGKAKVLDRARRAARLAGTEAELGRRRGEVLEAGRAVDRARIAAEKAEAARAEAAAALERETAREAEREEVRRRSLGLDALAEPVEKLAEARAALDSGRREEARLAREVERGSAAVAEAEAKLPAARERLERARGLGGRADALGQALAAARGARTQAKKLAEVRRTVEKDRARRDAAGHDLKAAERELAASRAEAEAAESAWRAGQAALLARSLVAGAPCPVCGSPDHPAPAPAAGEVPSEATLDAIRASLRRLDAAREAALRTSLEGSSAVAAREAEAGAIESALGDAARETPAALEGRVRGLEEEVRAAEAALAEAPALEATLRDLEGGKTAAAAKLDETRERHATARAGAEGRRASVEAAEAGIPPELREPALLAAARDVARAALAGLEAALQRAAERADGAGREAVRRAAEATAADAAAGLARERAEAQGGEFGRLLAEEGFADEADFRGARLADADARRLEAEVREFGERLGAARERGARAAAAAGGLEPPDLPALETALAAAETAREAAVREEGAHGERADRLSGALARLAELSGRRAEIEARWNVHGKIAQVATGTNRDKVTFQRFVLGSLLDEVLMAATRRLEIMSRHRFRLRRAMEKADGRTAGGLDLEVLDDYSGLSRPAGTLSGGESFLAALALALGLADVVQAYSGGIHLETIFIDEGFGSLDPEALDLALRTLVDLQAGGRLVGIISHVPELKERIDARLEVAPGRAGSVARFALNTGPRRPV